MKFPVKSDLSVKLFLVFILGLLIFIPIGMIKGVVRDRLHYREEAMNSVLMPIGDSFLIRGVSVLIPYLPAASESDKKPEKEFFVAEPVRYEVTADLNVSKLKRGIFDTPVYDAAITISGRFDASDFAVNGTPLAGARLIFDVADRKNLTKEPEMQLNGDFQPKRDHLFSKPSGLYIAPFAWPLTEEQMRNGFDFTLTAVGRGGKQFILRPISGENIFTVRSNWNDPGFFGDWLPIERTVSDEGFSARWEIPGFNVSSSFSSVTDSYYDDGEIVYPQSIRVSFLQMNDIYNRVQRCMKYAFLFIFVPFLSLFFVEAVRKIPIHPAQYLLIGIANALFYLLLLSLAEQIPFNAAYLISMIMTVLLSSFYTAAVTKSKKPGFIMAVVSLTAYFFLFGLLQISDYALLVGTFGLFAALAIVMYLTRNVNWYRISDRVVNSSTEKKTQQADDPNKENRD